jgi:hypothetical protein
VSVISLVYNIKAREPHLFPPRRGGAKKRKIRENVTSVVTGGKITNYEFQRKKCHMGGDKI